jgi:hypothetical protein
LFSLLLKLRPSDVKSIDRHHVQMNPLDPKLLILSILISAIIFIAVAFSTRATIHRILGVLIAATPIVPYLLVLDTIAARLDWWHYPSVGGGSTPLAWYISAALGYGAALGLIGWRVIRRWATHGLYSFLVGFALFGVGRDYAYSLATQLIVFGPGPIPLLADLFAYATAAMIVQLLMRWIVGPAGSDALARIPETGK